VNKRHISPNQTKSEGNSKILKLSDFKPAHLEEKKGDDG
jgi:hypothetical protein